jgi:hypothetical protein
MRFCRSSSRYILYATIKYLACERIADRVNAPPNGWCSYKVTLLYNVVEMPHIFIIFGSEVDIASPIFVDVFADQLHRGE